MVRIGDLRASEAHPDLYTPCDVRNALSMKEVLTDAGAIVNLAAEHRDDVRPISRYYETNVEGAKQICEAASKAGNRTIIFTSSVAVYGFHPFPVDEEGPFRPFNPYGETKLRAEAVYRAWAEEDPTRSLVIIRPTVVFGEGNRGNVYNLFNQIASGRFIMVGSGANRKSMAYVGNVVDALVHCLMLGPGTHIFNYVDTPDMNMNELVELITKGLGQTKSIRWRIPFFMAMAGGHVLDFVARITERNFPISAVRVKKFCESTRFKAEKIRSTGFMPRISLEAGLVRTIQSEFIRHS